MFLAFSVASGYSGLLSFFYNKQMFNKNSLGKNFQKLNE